MIQCHPPLPQLHLLKMDKKNIALVLEGGGAKCAYQAGALVALEEFGFTFNVISGASFGALNGALYVEGGTKRLFDFYHNLSSDDIFLNKDIKEMIETYNKDEHNLLGDIMAYISKNVHYYTNRQVETDHYHNTLLKNINAEAIKKSDKEYYCTVLKTENSLTTTAKLIGAFSGNTSLLEMYKNKEIEGRIISKEIEPLDRYIVASANYPTYAPIEVNGEYFLDGGIYDNVPYKHLLYKGIKSMVIIRTNIDDLKDFDYQNPDILVITPSKYLGSSLRMTHDKFEELLKFGYTDAKQILLERFKD